MRGPTRFATLLTIQYLLGLSAHATAAERVSGVAVEIKSVSPEAGSLHWKITNQSKVEIYLYDVFLLGPAFAIERIPGTTIFDTTPLHKLASCVPNRYLPVLLIVIRSGGTIEGDFADEEIKKLARGTKISLKVAVGPEPYSVIARWQRFLNSDCKHSPYDAIATWGTIIESKPSSF
jgi:hypothetical protein